MSKKTKEIRVYNDIETYEGFNEKDKVITQNYNHITRQINHLYEVLSLDIYRNNYTHVSLASYLRSKINVDDTHDLLSIVKNSLSKRLGYSFFSKDELIKSINKRDEYKTKYPSYGSYYNICLIKAYT